MYFYLSYSTLNKIVLSYFDIEKVQYFLSTYVFIKMGGIFGHNLQIFFYKYLSYKNLIKYTITNLYVYMYIFNFEKIFYYNEMSVKYIIFFIILNYLSFIYNFEKFKTKRDFLFFSSQMLLINTYFFIFFF